MAAHCTAASGYELEPDRFQRLVQDRSGKIQGGSEQNLRQGWALAPTRLIPFEKGPAADHPRKLDRPARQSAALPARYAGPAPDRLPARACGCRRRGTCKRRGRDTAQVHAAFVFGQRPALAAASAGGLTLVCVCVCCVCVRAPAFLLCFYLMAFLQTGRALAPWCRAGSAAPCAHVAGRPRCWPAPLPFWLFVKGV